MNFEQFKDRCLELALEKGCENAEIYCATQDSFSVNILNGELDRYSIEKDNGLNLRVTYNGKCGYAYTELFENPETLVEKAIDNAKVIESSDLNPMQGACEYEQVSFPEDPAFDLTEGEKIGLAMRMERETLDFDGRVDRLLYCTLQTISVTTKIFNTLGLHAENKRNISFAAVQPVLRQGDEVRSGFAYRTGKQIFDCSSMIKEAVDDALMKFNAKPVDSGNYRVLLRNNAAVDFIAAFSGMFSADDVQKGLSLLAGKLDKDVANENVTIVDDPFEKDNPRAFDDEGVPSVRTEVIEKGVLKSFLHNLKTAQKDGVKSTSNAGRSGAEGSVEVLPSNFMLMPGEKSFDELVTELGNGLIITDLSGLHAGLNPVSGDFSLIASGLLVESGSIIRSVEQITFAGNFLSVMKDIEAVGSDMRFSMPGSSRFGCPSLLIKNIIISG